MCFSTKKGVDKNLEFLENLKFDSLGCKTWNLVSLKKPGILTKNTY